MTWVEICVQIFDLTEFFGTDWSNRSSSA